jgi:hypothetical protein
MRLRSLTSLTLAASSLVAITCCTPAVAQIEFAKSTIRFKSAPEPVRATDKKRAEVSALEQPQAIAPAPAFAAAPAAGPAPVALRQVHAPVELPRTPVARHTVRQATYEEPVATQPQSRTQLPGRAPSRVGVYSGTSAKTTLSKLPSPTPVQPKPAGLPAYPRGKPFQSVESEPAISPYMNLYRSDRDGNAPLNYMTLVRPQLDQIQANRQQAVELQKLRGQLQNMSAGGSGGIPSATMGSSARYMDTAQFYGKLHR